MVAINGVETFSTSDVSKLTGLFDALAAETAEKTAGVGGSDETPPAESAAGKSIAELGLPVLSAPTGGLSLDTLMKAIGDDVRRQTCKSGVEALEAKADQQKEVNEKELQEIADRLAEMKKKSVLNGFLKVFKIIGMVVGAIASAVSVAAGAITGNPLLVAASVVGLAMLVDSALSEASDGKYSIAAGFSELGKKCGMSDEAANWFGFGMNMAVMIASIAVSFGAGAASNAGKVAQVSSEAVQKAAEVTTTASKIANISSGVLTASTGAGNVAGAVIDYNIASSKADSKELEAILERLREAIEAESEMVKAEMERADDLMGKVKEIVDDCVKTQGAVLAGSPSMA